MRRGLVAVFSILCLNLSCRTHHGKDYSWAFVEMNPRPLVAPLWSDCSEIPTSKQDGKLTYTIAGHRYVVGNKLGEGGDGKVYKLKGLDDSSPSLIIKVAHVNDDSAWAYKDLLLHSTMQIIGVPTIKSGLGFVNDEGKRTFVLVKELVVGKDFGDYLTKLSINSINFFNPNVSEDSTSKLKLASRIFSRVINAGIYIDDMHSRNLMWDENKSVFLMVDGSITEDSVNHPVDPKKDFGRAIGIPEYGDKLFYERYYDPNETPSPESKALARDRIIHYFSKTNEFQKDCKSPAGDKGLEIDVHRVFGEEK